MRCLLIALTLAAAPVACFSDTVYFKNGTRMEGLARTVGNSVQLQVPEGTMNFGRDTVDRIVKCSSCEKIKKPY